MNKAGETASESTVEKRDPNFVKHYIAPLLLIMLLGVVGGLIAVCSVDNPDKAGILTLVIFIVVVAAGILHHRIVDNYRCPQCKQPLSRYQDEPERAAEWRFHCPDCKVTWNTGMRESNDA